MAERTASCPADCDMAADILENMARLMGRFHERDLALQNALSTLASLPGAPQATLELQYIDLLTQIHDDLANLLPVLSNSLRGTATTRGEIRNALTLRSLQDELIENDDRRDIHKDGDLSLF